MIVAISWLPKGAAKSVPAPAEPPSKEEVEEMLKSGVLQKSDEAENEEDNEEESDVEMNFDTSRNCEVEGDDEDSPVNNVDLTEAMKELDMDNYDDEEDGAEIFGSGLKDLYYASNKLDPYLKCDDIDSEEEEDTVIKSDDAVIVCARNEDDVSHLEVWVLDDLTDNCLNMYVHHDIIIPAFPLCTAWLDCPLKGREEKGNFIAVGSMEPAIEIWDLDIIDEVLPSVVLGGVAAKKMGKKKSAEFKTGSHTEAVLGLAWNEEYRNVLASASADKSVKIWDVSKQICDITMNDHVDKVQAVAWNPFHPKILLSGSFDRSVIVKDVRIPSHAGLKFSVAAQVESLKWDPHAENSFLVSLENGTISSFHLEAGADPNMKPSFTLHAHDKAVCSIAFNPLVPNLLATCSLDKTVKLWDLSGNQPSCIASRNPKAGALFSISFSNDYPYLLAMGGSEGKLEMWDILKEDAISKKYDQLARAKYKSK